MKKKKFKAEFIITQLKTGGGEAPLAPLSNTLIPRGIEY